MALANYADLQASIASWVNRTDLTAIIPDFIAIAEENHKRDLRLRAQITSATLTTVAGEGGILLPTDFLEMENLTVQTSPYRQLTYATIEQIGVAYPEDGTIGVPSLYTIEAGQILFGQIPDAVYNISALYYAPFASLSTSNTNWLLTNHPSIYLYSSLEQACIYIKDSTRAAEYKGLYEKAANDLQIQDDRAQHSGSSLRVRVI